MWHGWNQKTNTDGLKHFPSLQTHVIILSVSWFLLSLTQHFSCSELAVSVQQAPALITKQPSLKSAVESLLLSPSKRQGNGKSQQIPSISNSVWSLFMCLATMPWRSQLMVFLWYHSRAGNTSSTKPKSLGSVHCSEHEFLCATHVLKTSKTKRLCFINSAWVPQLESVSL